MAKVALGKDGLPKGQLFRGLTSLERFKEKVAELFPDKTAAEQAEIAKAVYERKSKAPKAKGKKAAKVSAVLAPTDLRNFKGLDYDALVSLIGKLQKIVESKKAAALEQAKKEVEAAQAKVKALSK